MQVMRQSSKNIFATIKYFILSCRVIVLHPLSYLWANLCLRTFSVPKKAPENCSTRHRLITWSIKLCKMIQLTKNFVWLFILGEYFCSVETETVESNINIRIARPRDEPFGESNEPHPLFHNSSRVPEHWVVESLEACDTWTQLDESTMTKSQVDQKVNCHSAS